VVLLNFADAERMLKIYPNPVVNGTITVSLKQASIVRVYNSIGVKLMQKELPAGEHLFNLSQLSRGTYYVKIKDESVLFVIQ
jgi:hypothetical protein